MMSTLREAGLTFTRKDVLMICLCLVLFVVAVGVLLGLLIELAPYLLPILIFPTWMAAALAEGAKV